jgi:glutamyl-tRNA(Gln) amidotransferase subunit D
MDAKLPGYRGLALKVLTEAGVEVGDVVRITKDRSEYEGTLMPRYELADDHHLVVKLRDGYNIGVELTPETRIVRIGVGSKPMFAAPPSLPERSGLPRVAVLSTGGTIASRVDYRTGAVYPALSASDLSNAIPELSSIAIVEAEILYSLFSENIHAPHWSGIAQRTAEYVERGVDGVVICHGTDTMGYTAAALSFALQDLPVPVVLVGAQRSSDRPSSDAALNLIGAVKVAGTAPFAEVALCMHEGISDKTIVLHRGTKVRKCHTSRRDAFKSVNSTPLAKLDGRGLIMTAEEYRRREPGRKLVLKPNFDERVSLIKFHPGFKADQIDFLVRDGCRGLVLEGTGLGHFSETMREPISRAIESGVLVGMTSQCIWGRVNMNVYNTGRDLQALGVIPLADMLPETALVKMMWIFGQTQDPEEARRLMLTNIAGEISPRSLIEGVEE